MSKKVMTADDVIEILNELRSKYYVHIVEVTVEQNEVVIALKMM